MEPSKAVSPLNDKGKEDEQASSNLPPNQPAVFGQTNFSTPQIPSDPTTQQLLATNYQQFAANHPVNHSTNPVNHPVTHRVNHPVEQLPINRLPTNAFPYHFNQFQLNQPANQYYWDPSNHQRYNQQGFYLNLSGYPYAGFQSNQHSQPPNSFDRSEPNLISNKPSLPDDSNQLIDLRKRNPAEEASRPDLSTVNEPASSDDKGEEETELNVIDVDSIASQGAGSKNETDGQTDAALIKTTDDLQNVQPDRTDQFSLNSTSTRASPTQAQNQTQFDHPRSTSCANALFAPVASSSACLKSTQLSARSSSLSERSIPCSFSSLIRTPPMPQSSQTLRTPVDPRTESIGEQPNSQTKFKFVEETQASPAHSSQAPIITSPTAVHRVAAVSEISFIVNLKNAIEQKESASAIAGRAKDSEGRSTDRNSDDRFDLSEIDSNDDLKLYLMKLDRLLELAKTYLNVSEVLKNQIKDLSQKILVFEKLDYDVDRTLMSFVTDVQKEKYFERLKVVKEALLQIEQFDERLDGLSEEPKSRTIDDADTSGKRSSTEESP